MDAFDMVNPDVILHLYIMKKGSMVVDAHNMSLLYCKMNCFVVVNYA